MSTQVIPPRIPNSEYQRHLGSGGFADVFLYRQRMPERDIAVKVIRPDASAEENGAFEAEANLMAKMSAHPSILSVFGAGVSDDDRSYLIMEYCPPPHMGIRAKKQQLPVPKVLDIGIRIAGAVETLHRSRILHRDIKPANILVSQFGHPVLTDFGIAVSTQPGENHADSGFSVPWAPPEQATGEGPFGPAMDVYSLAATIHTLLTGRSPFEIPGGDNREVAMMNRVLRTPVPKTGRSDVPPELERVLAVAMAKDPGQRYSSMMDFALALQQVQTDMHQRTTPIDVLEDRVADDLLDDDDDATRVRAFTAIDPDGPMTGAGPTRDVRDIPRDDATRVAVRRIDLSQGALSDTEIDDATRAVRLGRTTTSSDSQWLPSAQRFHGEQPPSQPPMSPSFTQGMSANTRENTTTPTLPPSPIPPHLHVPTEPHTESVPPDTREETSTSAKEINAPAGKGTIISILIGVLVIVMAIAFGLWTWMRDDGRVLKPETACTSCEEAPELLTVDIEPVQNLRGTINGDEVEFTWEPANGKVSYLYRLVDPLENHPVRESKEPKARVKKLDARTCIEVMVRQDNGKSSDPTIECVDTP